MISSHDGLLNLDPDLWYLSVVLVLPGGSQLVLCLKTVIYKSQLVLFLVDKNFLQLVLFGKVIKLTLE